MSKKDAKRDTDVWFRMKYMGYCLANLPPEEKSWELKDFYRMVRFRLAQKWGVSMKDPIFDRYIRPEELVVEYFAHRCADEEDFRQEIENRAAGKPEGYSETVDWMEQELEENKRAIEEFKRKKAIAEGQDLENAKIEEELDEEEDGFFFKPEDV